MKPIDHSFNKDKNQKELILDGKIVKFHYNKNERLAKVPFSRVQISNKYLKGKHYFFLIAQFVMILFVIFTYNILVGNSRSVKENGYVYILSKEPYNLNNYLKFYFIIKNTSNEIKNIDFVEFDFKVFNNQNELIYTKEFFITKDQLNPKEKYREMIIVNKPKKGKYKVIINYGNNKEKQLIYNFNFNKI